MIHVMLTDRQSQILNTIVDEYINTAMPVSSGVVLDRGFFDVSCPTIRNEMAGLTDMGFLAQPHTSAGRVPTEQGYRFFVDVIIDHTKRKPKARKVPAGPEIMNKAREVSGKTNDLVIVIDTQDGEVKYLGMKKVFENPEFRTHKSVVSMLEDLERFENYSEAICGRLIKDFEVFIGSENPFFENHDYGMISSRYNDSFIMLLGPMRMNYKVNLSLLL